MQTAAQTMSERVRQARTKAMEMMRKAGYELGDSITVTVDPKLPFMGYSMPQGGGYRIVVSGGAVESGMLEGLLVHEMSHIFRMQTKHPSHNGQVIEAVIASLGRQEVSKDYQQKIIHDLVNNIEDLYADDIAMQVLRNSQIFPMDRMSEFMQDWVRDELSKSKDSIRDRWNDSYTMANNARAIGQMKRHRIEDIEEKAAATNKSFLSKVSPSIARHFEYFQDLLTNMKEDVTEEDYRRFLASYLARFLGIAEGN